MTDYQKAVEKHMEGAPKELAEYVRGRLVSSHGEWDESKSSIDFCDFSWDNSKEGRHFWNEVDEKQWESAMTTDFWRSRTAPSEAPTIEFEKPEHEEYDFVNPKHYQEFSIEVIDMMASIWGKEATALHCEMCAFKYRLRIGSKPNQSIEDELGKINWYMEKAKELRDA